MSEGRRDGLPRRICMGAVSELGSLFACLLLPKAKRLPFIEHLFCNGARKEQVSSNWGSQPEGPRPQMIGF